MSRQPSIPRHLEPTILRRWTNGASPRAIARWIEESNATRKTPVTTTASSVLRCIERTAGRQSTNACLASVHRARLRSTTLMDTLEDVDDGYREVIKDTAHASNSHPNHSIDARLKALGKLELSTHRQLRVAGVGTAFGNALAATHAATTREMGRDIAAEDDLEDEGIAPEIAVRPLPTDLFPPPPLTLTIMAALRREQAELASRCSESKPLVSQPIAPPNRITSEPEFAGAIAGLGGGGPPRPPNTAESESACMTDNSGGGGPLRPPNTSEPESASMTDNSGGGGPLRPPNTSEPESACMTDKSGGGSALRPSTPSGPESACTTDKSGGGGPPRPPEPASLSGECAVTLQDIKRLMDLLPTKPRAQGPRHQQ